MLLSNTPTGVHANLIGRFCPNLPEGRQYIAVPLPGAGPFRCPFPCGGRCQHQNTTPPPPPAPKRLTCRLGLRDAQAELLAAAAAHPAGRPDTALGPVPRSAFAALVGQLTPGRN